MLSPDGSGMKSDMAAVFVGLVYLCCVFGTHAAVRQPPSVIEDGVNYCLSDPQEADPLCIYQEDGHVHLSCVASGIPEPEYTWYKNGKALDLNAPNIKLTGGNITISPATSLDSGYYQCHALNPSGTAVGRSYRLLKATLASYPPSSGPRQYQGTPGEPLKMECEPLTSVPDATISWAIVDDIVDESPRKLNMSNRINTDPQGNLYFSRIENSDAMGGRLYKCNLHNSLLDRRTGGSYSKINILNTGLPTDKPPAVEYHTPSPHIALVGREMVLKCLFSGSPPPSIIWVKREGQLPAGRYEFNSYNTELKITDIRESDEGKYECQASNQVGEKSQQDISVKVGAVPKFQMATLEVRPLNLNATDGEDVSFNCKPYAIPTASVQWLMNGEPIDSMGPPERMSVSSDGQTLTINKLCKDCAGERASDLMVIQCNASNVHGYSFGDGYLNVLRPTTLLTAPPSRVKMESGIPIELPCNAASDESTPVVYAWYFGDQKLVPNPPYTNLNDDNTLIINTEGLEGEDWKQYAGKYTCKASNGYSTVAADSLVELPPGAGPISDVGNKTTNSLPLLLAMLLCHFLLSKKHAN